MYEEYFGLERPPFKITPDTSLFFEGGKRGDILAALVYAINRGEGIIKVVGEVGSGKTMLCRMLQLKLPETVEIVYIANPSVSAEDILFVIAHELELPVEKNMSKHEVMRMLQDYLLQRHMENKQVVLFVEEAQGMPLDTLEEIRLLSNLETDQYKLMQIILFGQPELDQNLAQQSIRQLRERITHNFELEALTQNEIHNYLNFRMRQVGYTGPELISSSVAKKVEQHSAGLLRRINIIADKILLSAFAEGTHNLAPKHVTAAVNDSSFNQEAPRSAAWPWVLLLLALFGLAFGLYQTRAQWMAVAGLEPPPDTPPTAALENDSGTQPTMAAEPETMPKPSAATADPEATPQSSAYADSETAQQAPATTDPEAAPREPSTLQSDTMIVRTAAPEFADETVNSEPVQDAIPAEREAENGPQTEEAASSQMAALADRPQAASAESETPGTEVVIETSLRDATVSATDPQGGESKPEISQDREPVATTRRPGAIATPGEAIPPASEAESDYRDWLDRKLAESLRWLDSADGRKMSIQVMMRRKSAARDLVYYLRNEWPLDISRTYLYEVTIEGRSIYRVFYSEYDTVLQARQQIDQLPETIKVNLPYVHSVNRMRNALL